MPADSKQVVQGGKQVPDLVPLTNGTKASEYDAKLTASGKARKAAGARADAASRQGKPAGMSLH